jgi:hypothetical protein
MHCWLRRASTSVRRKSSLNQAGGCKWPAPTERRLQSAPGKEKEEWQPQGQLVLQPRAGHQIEKSWGWCGTACHVLVGELYQRCQCRCHL